MKRFLFSFFSLLFLVSSSQAQECLGTWYEGEGTHYGGIAGGEGGHCGLPVDSGDRYHAALNHTQYASSVACGACVRVLGPKGTVILKIVDECPECKFGDIDVTTAVFPELAELKDGRIKIKWQYVPCTQLNDIKVVFAPGSGPYFFKAQFRDFLYPLAKVEYKKADGTYDTLHRETYNYFVKQGGVDEDKSKTGPYTFRLSPLVGEPIVLVGIPFQTEQAVSTNQQFSSVPCPDCAGEAGGTALVDHCGVCSGGNTGIAPQSTCQKDCYDYWEGTAYVDGCGKCVAGTTGLTPCDQDCNGVAGGQAFKDRCGNCVGGTTGKIACKKDCHNEWGGTAFRDSCGLCAGGNTNLSPLLDRRFCTSVGWEEELLFQASPLAYPNPFENELLLKAPLGSFVEVWDSKGTRLFSFVCKGQALDTRSLAKGLYFLLVKGDGFVRSVKVEKR